MVEDDYDAEYRYDRQPVGAVQGLAPDRVVYAGSVSKTLAPALRLGWLLTPPSLTGPIAQTKASDDLGTPIVEQLALADFLECGELDRHLRRTRPIYRARRDALVTAIDRHLPGCVASGVAAGLHLVLHLPPGHDERALLTTARSDGIALYGLSEHSLSPRPAALILGYGRIAEPGNRVRRPRARRRGGSMNASEVDTSRRTAARPRRSRGLMAGFARSGGGSRLR